MFLEMRLFPSNFQPRVAGRPPFFLRCFFLAPLRPSQTGAFLFYIFFRTRFFGAVVVSYCELHSRENSPLFFPRQNMIFSPPFGWFPFPVLPVARLHCRFSPKKTCLSIRFFPLVFSYGWFGVLATLGVLRVVSYLLLQCSSFVCPLAGRFFWSHLPKVLLHSSSLAFFMMKQLSSPF